MRVFLRAFSFALLVGSAVLYSGCSKSSDPTPPVQPPVQNGAIIGPYLPANALTAVTATPVGGGTALNATVNTGNYTFGSLPIGNYTLTYTVAPGFDTPAPQTVTVVVNYTLPLAPITVERNTVTLLTRANWRLTGYTSTINSTGVTTDDFAGFPACYKDSFLKFNRDRTGVFDEGPTKCSPNDPQTTSLPWALEANDTQLVLNPGSTSSSRFVLRELTTTTLKLEYTSFSGSFTDYITYTAF